MILKLIFSMQHPTFFFDNYMAMKRLTKKALNLKILADSSTDSKTVSLALQKHALRNGDRLAAEDCQASVTYAEVFEKSSQIAQTLLARGLKPEMPVVIFMDRGLDLLIGFLGVIMAGGAYVPVVPNYPQERIKYILSQITPCVIIASDTYLPTARLLCEGTPNFEPHHLVSFSELSRAPMASQALPAMALDQLAYIIFTSGSTGLPKGAMVTHRGMINHLRAKKDVSEVLRLSETDIVAQTAPQGFDISVWQMLCPLFYGAHVVIVPDEIAKNPVELFRFAIKKQVTILEIVPSLLAEIFQYPDLLKDMQTGLRLKYLMLTGEALKPALAQQFRKEFPHIPIINAYGPTECSDDVTHEIIDSQTKDLDTLVSIGRPIQGASLSVIVEEEGNLRVSKTGEEGELWISGPCVGRGYYRDPVRTAQHFVIHSFQGEPSSRYYRTGDRVKQLPDGRFYYLGRIDRQIKLLGNRIELGEIESAMASITGVKDCAVIFVRPDQTTERLVARRMQENTERPPFLVAFVDTTLEIAEIQSVLSRHLPGYMIPRFIVKTTLPVTPHGKTDYLALEVKARSYNPDIWLQSGKTRVQPKTPLEKHLVECAAKICRIDPDLISIEDSIYAIGIDSLLFMSLMTKMESELNIKIPRDFHDHLESLQTMSDYLAELLDTARHTESSVSLLPRAESSCLPKKSEPSEATHTWIPLTPQQERIFLVCQAQPDNPFYNFCGWLELVHTKGEFNRELFGQTWQLLLARHEGLRLNIVLNEFRFGQNFAPKGRALTMTDIDITAIPVGPEQDAACHKMMLEAAAKPIDLLDKTAYLWRIIVMRRTPTKISALFIFHEIVVDGWGLSELLQEFSQIYEALLESCSASLPPLSKTCSAYAMEKAQYPMPHAYWEPHKIFWHQALCERPVTALQLPYDHPMPAQLNFRGDFVQGTITAEQAKALKKLASETNTTLFVVLNTLYKTMLYFYTNQTDIVVGAPYSDRGDSEHLVAFIINMVAYRSELDPHLSIRELVANEKQRHDQVRKFADFPFQYLVELVRQTGGLETFPIFQTMFNFLNFPQTQTKSKRFRLRFAEEDFGRTKYPISFYGQESDGMIPIQFSFMTELFQKTTIQNMMITFLDLIKITAANPNQRLSEINFEFSPVKLSRLEGPSLRLPDQNVFGYLQKHATENPHAIALIEKSTSLSFEQLYDQVLQTARALQQWITYFPFQIAIAMDTSTELIVLLLAIQRLGAAYIPISKSDPDSRITQILDQVRPAIFVIDDEDSRFSAYSACTVLRRSQIMKNPTLELPAVAYNPSALFAIMHTSGSTGIPKGVLISYGSVMNRLQWGQSAFGLDTDKTSVIACHKPASVVGAFGEFFQGIFSGVRTVIISDNERHEPSCLTDIFHRHRVTHFHASPAMLKMLCTYFETNPGHKKDCESLRVVTSSASQLPWALTMQWNLAVPYAPVQNMLGLTECSSNITRYLTGPESPAGIYPTGFVPAGSPIANTKIQILNRYGQIVPEGGYGQVVISGTPLAMGYTVNSEGSWTSFRPEGYFSGDIGRIQNDILYLIGRNDDQFKVSGYTLHAAEVERHLCNHPHISCAVVTLEEDILCAYLELKEILLGKDLNQFLREKVPHYMLPERYYRVSTIPKTSLGKPNRLVLKSLPRIEIPFSYDKAKAKSVFEEAVIYHYSQIKTGRTIDLDDDFHFCGMASIDIVTIANRLTRSFRLDISFLDVYSHSTPRQLAELIEQRIYKSDQTESSGMEIFNPEKTDAFFVFPSLVGFGAFFKKFSPHFPDHTFYSFDFVTASTPQAVERQYMERIQKIKPHGPINIMGRSTGGLLAINVGTGLARQGRDVRVFVLDAYLDFFGKDLHAESFTYNVLKRDPENAALIARDSVVEKARLYLRYVCNREVIWDTVLDPRRIYYIFSGNKPDEMTKEVSEHFVHIKALAAEHHFPLLQGFGPHSDMIFGDFGVQNAGIITKTLWALDDDASQKTAQADMTS